MMINRDNITEAIDLIRQVVRELATTPVYVVRASQIPGHGKLAIGGATAKNMDIAVRPFVPEWKGRGVGIVIADEVEISDLLCIIAHECAHAIRDGYLNNLPDETLLHAEFAGKAIRLALSSEQATKPTKAISDGHDAVWLRCVLHLRSRLAWKADAVLGVSEIVSYGSHVLPLDIHSAHRALLACGEYEQLADATFEQILNTPPPEAFTIALATPLPTYGVASERQTERDHMKVFELVAQAFGKAERDRHLTVAEYVRLAVNDQTIDPDTVARALRAAGQKPEHFEAEVDRIRKRRRLVASVAAGVEARAELAFATEKIKRAEAEFIAVQQQHVASIMAMQAEADAASRKIREAKEAEASLRQTAEPELRDRLAKSVSLTAELAAKQSVLRRRIADARAIHDVNANNGHAPATRNADTQRLRDELDRVEQSIANAQAETVRLKAEALVEA